MIGTVLFVALFQLVGGGTAAASPPADSSTTPPAVAATPAQTGAPQTTTTQQNDRHTVHCHLQNVTGSRLGKRVCLSQAEEEAIANDAHDLVRQEQAQHGLAGN